MPVEDEIIHWWKDEKGEGHRNALRIESEQPQLQNGFPRDGVVTVRLMNSASNKALARRGPAPEHPAPAGRKGAPEPEARDVARARGRLVHFYFLPLFLLARLLLP